MTYTNTKGTFKCSIDTIEVRVDAPQEMIRWVPQWRTWKTRWSKELNTSINKQNPTSSFNHLWNKLSPLVCLWIWRISAHIHCTPLKQGQSIQFCHWIAERAYQRAQILRYLVDGSKLWQCGHPWQGFGWSGSQRMQRHCKKAHCFISNNTCVSLCLYTWMSVCIYFNVSLEP
jgi:hypothetical protein